MKLACVWTALMMSLPPAGTAQARYAQSSQGADTPAQESRTPASVIGSKEERVGKAANFYEKGRFVEAALEFEGLVKDFPQEPNYLFNAAVSRYGAGHYAHTVAYTREYLAHKTLSPEDRKEAEAQLTEALRKAVTVRVSVRAAPGGAGEVTVVAQHVARASSDLRPELLFPVKLAAQPVNLALELDPGAWTLRVEGGTYQTAERRVELVQGAPNALEFALALAVTDDTPPGPAPVREVPADVVRKMKLGLGIAGGVGIVAGIVVPVIGAGRARKLDGAACDPVMGAEDPYAQCRLDWRNAYRMRDAGLAALGGGVGLLAGGLTWMVRDPHRRRTALLVETAIGGVAAVGGFASLFATSQPFTRRNEAEDWATQHTGIPGTVGGHAASMAIFGFGLGMLTSAAVGLGVQRRHVGSLRAGAMTGAGQAGVMLSGSF